MKFARVRALLAGAVALILLLAALTVVYAELEKGRKAPEFKLSSVDGKMLSLKEIRKDPAKKGATRVVLLDFWATWCPPCVAEIPDFVNAWNTYKSKNVQFFGISDDDVNAIADFVKVNKMTYPTLLDGSSDFASCRERLLCDGAVCGHRAA